MRVQMTKSSQDAGNEAASGKVASALQDPLLQSTLDALTMPVALLDEAGGVIGINVAWRHPSLPGLNAQVGDNYLQVCEAAMRDTPDAGSLRDGLTGMLNARHKTFERVWRHLSASEPRDFRVRFKRLSHYVPARFLVSYEEITELMQAQETAREAGERVLEVQIAERQRLAAELHDSIGQNLVSLGLWLARLRTVTPATEGMTAIIGDMSSALQEAQTQIRTLSYLLHPPWREREGGLENALRKYIEGFGQRAGLGVEIRLKGPLCRLDRTRELALFRILQEALVNVHRHAHAQKVSVTLTNQATEVTLEVSDDGCGLSSSEGGIFAPGVGILGMRTRIAQLGGELSIDSGSEGTTVRAKLRLDRVDLSPP
jgi:two-component system NarL family sensor kinase